MLYAIKADNEIAYIGCTDNLREEYDYHQIKLKEAAQDGLNAPEDLYFYLSYWKDMEHRKIRIVELDVGQEDEEVVRDIVIRALKPIGNVMDWELRWEE